MVQYMMATEARSYDQAMQADKEAKKLSEGAIHELKTDLFQKKEELESTKKSLNLCTNTHNLLKNEADHFIDQLSHYEALTQLEYEVKLNLEKGDEKLLLSAGELLQSKADYQARLKDIKDLKKETFNTHLSS